MNHWYTSKIVLRLIPTIVLIVLGTLLISQSYRQILFAFQWLYVFLLKERPDILPVISLLAVILAGLAWEFIKQKGPFT